MYPPGSIFVPHGAGISRGTGVPPVNHGRDGHATLQRRAEQGDPKLGLKTTEPSQSPETGTAPANDNAQ